MFKNYRFSALNVSSLIFLSSIVLSQTADAVENAVPMTTLECKNDFNFVAQFLLKNDAGVVGQNWTSYPQNVQNILDTQISSIQAVQTTKDCKNIITPFLASIRKGHLYLQATSIKQELEKSEDILKSDLLKTQKLSDQTTYIFIPSFSVEMKDQLEKMIKNNQDNVLNARYLILDLRKNGGGMDSSAEPLYPLLGEAEYWLEVPKLYSTAANIQSYKNTTQAITDPADKKFLTDLIQSMQHKQNAWVSMFPDNSSVLIEKVTKKDAVAHPTKVVLLIDEDTGSSGEEFVKDAKQNPSVVLMGRNTYGALDASNVRDVLLPSKKLYLDYATTYIQRRSGQQIDGIGIPPNIKLAKPLNQQTYDNEVNIAQAYLENVK